MGILEKIISNGERILDIIKSIIEYDMPTASDTILRARAEIITKKSNNNLITIFKDRVLSSELSNILKDFKSITVNNNNIKKPQSKKRKRNKYYYTEDITHDFQSSIASNKNVDIIKYIQLLTQWRSFSYMYYK